MFNGVRISVQRERIRVQWVQISVQIVRISVQWVQIIIQNVRISVQNVHSIHLQSVRHAFAHFKSEYTSHRLGSSGMT